MEVVNQANKTFEKIGETVANLGDKVSQHIPEGYGGKKVKESLKNTGEYLKDTKVEDMTSHVNSFVSQNPLLSLGLSLGLGFFIGKALFASR